MKKIIFCFLLYLLVSPYSYSSEENTKIEKPNKAEAINKSYAEEIKKIYEEKLSKIQKDYENVEKQLEKLHIRTCC